MLARRVLLLEEPSWGGVQTMSRTLADGLMAQGWQVTALPWRQTAWGTLVQAAKQHDVIVATHNFGPTYAGAALKAITGKPLVSWVHGPLQDVLHTARASALKKLWLKQLYKQVSGQQRCTVVPNGLGNLPPGQPLHVHAGHGGEGLAPLLLGYVGRLSAEKQPGLLLETLRFLPHHAQLGVVGEGPLHRQLVHDGMARIVARHSLDSFVGQWQEVLRTC